MKDLIIYGAGTSVIVKLLHAINRHSPQWNCVGFVDDDEAKWGKDFYGYPVLGGSDLLASEKYKNTFVVCFIYGRDIGIRMEALKKLNQKDLQYGSLIHPEVNLEFVFR